MTDADLTRLLILAATVLCAAALLFACQMAFFLYHRLITDETAELGVSLSYGLLFFGYIIIFSI